MPGILTGCKINSVMIHLRDHTMDIVDLPTPNAR